MKEKFQSVTTMTPRLRRLRAARELLSLFHLVLPPRDSGIHNVRLHLRGRRLAPPESRRPPQQEQPRPEHRVRRRLQRLW